MSKTAQDCRIPLPRLPPDYVELWIDDMPIPDSFDDDCFQKVEARPWEKNNQSYDACLKVIFGVVNQEGDYHICGEALEAVVRSKYFQTHAKQIKYLQLTGFWLDDWKPFLDLFVRNKPKLMYLSLVRCNLTEQGARSLGWVLENNDSGLQIEALNFDFLRGSNQWISGLLNNTTVKTIVTKQLDCGVAFLDCLRKCCLRKFRFAEYNGCLLQNEKDDEESFSDTVTIRLFRNDHKPSFFRGSFPISLEMSYAWGALFLGIDEPVNLHHPQHLPKHLIDCWERFHNLRNFQQKKPQRLKLCLDRLGSLDSLFQAVMTTSYDVPVTLQLSSFSLTDQAAICLGQLLDTDASRVNVESLIMESLGKGGDAWVPGLYKNKSIKTLRLEYFNIWHSALHFIRIASAGKLENVTLCNIREEGDGKPIGVDDETIAASVETCKNQMSLEKFVCKYDIMSVRDRKKRSRYLCSCIGMMLRSTHLKYLELAGIQTNPDYDFLKDAVFCREICLKNTDFEPHGLASLIDNNGGHLKRLCLDWQWSSIGSEKVTALLEQTDLTSLDEFDAGSLPVLSHESLLALQRRFRQNKGPRKLAMSFHPDIDDEEDFTNENFEELGKSLTGNTKIEELKLKLPISVFIDPSVMLKFLRLVCAMPSLTHLEIYRFVSWDAAVNDETPQKWFVDLKICKQLIVAQLLEKSRWIDLSSWMGDNDFSAMMETLRKCRLLLGCDANDLPDGLWAHVFAGVGTVQRNLKDVSFSLLGQLPRLCQQALDQAKKEKGPCFIVPHSPDCPACHKRQKCELV